MHSLSSTDSPLLTTTTRTPLITTHTHSTPLSPEAAGKRGGGNMEEENAEDEGEGGDWLARHSTIEKMDQSHCLDM